MPRVLITGANRGLGLEFARQYQDAGWEVLTTCRRPDLAEDLNGLSVEVIPLDVLHFDGISDLSKALGGGAYLYRSSKAARVGL